MVMVEVYEGRQFPRVKAGGKVLIDSPIMDGDRLTGTIEQLSLGGCLFSTHTAFEKGRVLTFVLEVDGVHITIVGEVVYRRMKDEDAHMFGVRFEYLAPEDQRILAEYIDKCAQCAA